MKTCTVQTYRYLFYKVTLYIWPQYIQIINDINERKNQDYEKETGNQMSNLDIAHFIA